MKIRRLVVALALVVCAATRASAVGVYNDGEANPLRLVAFAIAPVGYLAEWLITRPIFRVVSQDDMAPVFSYTPQAGFDYETYQEGLSTGVTFEDPHGMD
jgi:hypothetical protein